MHLDFQKAAHHGLVLQPIGVGQLSPDLTRKFERQELSVANLGCAATGVVRALTGEDSRRHEAGLPVCDLHAPDQSLATGLDGQLLWKAPD